MLRRLSIILLDVLAAVLVLVIILLMISIVNAPNNPYGMPGVGRLGFLAVQDTGHMVIVDRIGLDNLGKGDSVVYHDDSNGLVVNRVVDFKDGTYFISGRDADPANTFPAVGDRMGGRVLYSVPYLGYVITFMGTGPGIALCIAIPVVIILTLLSVFIIDGVHNSSKHRKRILRKKRRRNNRYMEEGLYKGKRAAI